MRYSRIATTYDQNPARLAITIKRTRRNGRPALQALFGIQLLLGFVAVYFWQYLAN